MTRAAGWLKTLGLGALGAVLVATGAPQLAEGAATREPYCATAVVHGPGGALVDKAPTRRGCRYDIGTTTTDPVIAISRKGIVFVSLEVGGVMRSGDHGRSWTKVVVPPLANGDNHNGGVHGFVHIDTRTDRLYYSTSAGAASCGGSTGTVVSWSDDLGRTWDGSTVGCDTYDWGKVLTGPAPKSNAYPSALYFFGVAERQVGAKRVVYRSLNGGKTWTKMKNLASSTTEGGAGVVAPDGTIYFDYPEFPGFDPTGLVEKTYPKKPENLCKQMVAVSRDYGQTWTQQAIPGSRACFEGAGNERVAVDRGGAVYAVWIDDLDGRTRMVVSHDHARTWSEPLDVMPPGMAYTNAMANIVAGRKGHVVITTMDTDRTLVINPRIGIVPGIGDYDTFLTETFNADAASPRFETVDLDPAGDPSLTTGQLPTEAEAFVTLNERDEPWTVFNRNKSVGPLDKGTMWAATIGPLHRTKAKRSPGR